MYNCTQRLLNCNLPIYKRIYMYSSYFNHSFAPCGFFSFCFSGGGFVRFFRFWQAFGLSGTTSPPWQMYNVHPTSKSSHDSMILRVTWCCKLLFSYATKASVLGASHHYLCADKFSWTSGFRIFRCLHASLGGANSSKPSLALYGVMKEPFTSN